MTGLTVRLYRYFRAHGIFLYSLLGITAVLMAVITFTCLELDENIVSFLPDTKDSREMVEVFDNLKVSDRFVLMLSVKENVTEEASLPDVADSLVNAIMARAGSGLVREAVSSVGQSEMQAATEFIYDYLPIFLDDAVYARLDSLEIPQNISDRMRENRAALLSPAGSLVKDFILKDPLGITFPVLSSLSGMKSGGDYGIEDGHIWSPDGKTLLCFLVPEFGTGETGRNDRLVTIVEEELDGIMAKYPSVRAEYFAGPAVGVYNARQIKKDTLLTSAFALILIGAVIFLSFKRRRSVILIFLPVLYGTLFSLCLIALVKGSISAIAVGTGAIVLGIALSYSIHVIVHQMHVDSVEQLIRETAFPLTVGSLTTIGAFLGLLFTSSPLLHDFGLFASLTLVGTTLFTLVFLPHFLSPQSGRQETPFLLTIEKISGYGYEKNRWLVILIVLLFITSLFTSRNVGFNADMMSINYMPEHLRQSMQRLESMNGGGDEEILFVSTGKSLDEAVLAYDKAGILLDSLSRSGYIRHHSSARNLIVPESLQQERLEKWDSYWTEDRIRAVQESVDRAAADAGFRPGTFSGLRDMLSRDYPVLDYLSEDISPLLDNWICASDSLFMLVSDVSLEPELKGSVYPCFRDTGTVVFDRSWFAGSAVRTVSDDLDLVLFLSSLIVFLGLWISYRRLELAVLSFLPMIVTWIIIIGLMGITGMEFNIVTIVISTFIFGIGDDFSIFVTDGLSRKYAVGKDMLTAHRTAIFFSAFTVVAGMGAMIAAVHPALHSVGAISLLGMSAVLLISYTLQPLLFRFFVTGPASRGEHPYTLRGLVMSLLLWLEFLTACLVTILVLAVLLPVPVSRYRKQVIVRYIAYLGCRCVLFTAPIARAKLYNPTGEDFSRPAIVVGNHQSFLDIVWMMALNPKLLVVAKGWVRKVPVFYPVARFLGFYYTDAGYDSIAAEFGGRVREGWSLAVFPEGTRETDGKIHRFHKGAFYIAQRLDLDIVPVVLYGNGRIFPKSAPLNMAEGVSVAEILPRIPSGGLPYQLQARKVREMIERRYRYLEESLATVDNPYYFWALRRSMLYKGVAAERSTEAILRRKEALALLDESLPRRGRILHLGCGMGQTDLLMKMLAPEREMVAVDRDEENIYIASHNRLCSPGLEFVCADPDSVGTEGYDAVILPDWTVRKSGTGGLPLPDDMKKPV